MITILSHLLSAVIHVDFPSSEDEDMECVWLAVPSIASATDGTPLSPEPARLPAIALASEGRFYLRR